MQEGNRTAYDAWREFVRPTRRAKPRIAPILKKADFAEVISNGIPLATWRVGAGPAVLLVHGYSDDHTLWTPLMERLAEQGRAFVAFDLPGHGLSGGDEGVVRLCADAVKAVASARGPIDAIVGHSLGGLSAAVAISEGLKVERTVIAATARDRRRRLDSFAAEHGLSQSVVDELQSLHAARFGNRDMSIGIPDLHGLEGRALIIHSHEDERVPVDASEATQAVWPGSELWLIHGPDHRKTARVAEVVERIANFVSDAA